MKYTDNMEFPEFIRLVVLMNYKYNQSMSYFDKCAKRMARYAIKNKPLKSWPRHIREKYNFVVNTHTEAMEKITAPILPGVVYST